MSTSRHVDKICLAAVAVTLVLTFLLMFGGSLGLSAAERTVKYESTLFDTSYVHRIDIVMDGWESFIERCENEEYANCTVVVDGEKHANIAIRAKGNTSLSSVKSMGSQRYSFKLEFDRNEPGKTLDGLDKLCLNNLIQDNTMMKDYLVYRMMADFDVDSPLCSFAYLTVNGEDWGLYLAVEGVEDSFLVRNYGADCGELYKPDSMRFGGGRGNGKDFNPEDLEAGTAEEAEGQEPGGDLGGLSPGDRVPDGLSPDSPWGQGQAGGFPGGRTSPGGFPPEGQAPGGQHTQMGPGGFPGRPEGNGQQDDSRGGPGGMGSDDVKLKYIDDDPASYPNIFDNAKTDTSAADQNRLIAALRQLSAQEHVEEILDAEEVLRYFVVHNFVCNGDSYTGSMIHNYYLHEQDGRLGMIPWDYNLAFGTFQGGSAASAVNASIDSPVTGGSLEDRPMAAWIFSEAAHTDRYHSLFTEFLDRWFSRGRLETMITETTGMIRPYVEKDLTKFCSTETFEQGAVALSRFVSLRAEAVRRQLSGDDSPVDTGDLNLSAMGNMGGNRGGLRNPSSEGTEKLPGMPADDPPPALPEGSAEEPPSLPDWNGGEIPPGASGSPAASDRTGRVPLEDFPGGAGGQRGQTDAFGRDGAQPQMPEAGTADARPQAESGGTWILLSASVLVLAAGLVIAVRKKY